MVTQCSVAPRTTAFRDPEAITAAHRKDEIEKQIESSISSNAQCLIIRGDADWTWDYSLFLTHDPNTKTTFVLVVGLTAVEIDLVGSYLSSLADDNSHAPTSIAEDPLQTHPLLLPMILLDLAVDDTASLLKLRAKLLSQIQQQTGMDRFNSLKSTTVGKRSSGVKSKEKHWERQELDLDGVMLRLTCLSDWVAAQRGFAALQGRVVDVVGAMLGDNDTQSRGDVGISPISSSAENSFRERLAFIQESLVAAEQKCVYLERSIASQVQTVSTQAFGYWCSFYSLGFILILFADILPHRPER